MGLYQRVFARLMACGDRAQHQMYSSYKRGLFADLEGTVVEIGPGTGVNFMYYPPGIRWIGLEPNVHMHEHLYRQMRGRKIDADLRATTLEEAQLPAGSADAVVSTLVLCSVSNLDAALQEIRRVLKPGGRFYFIEHVVEPRYFWRRLVQHSIRPAWQLLADGCRPNRDTGAAIQQAGFRSVRYQHMRTGTPVISPHIIGIAFA